MKPILPYSEKAMDENTWAVGWMLLDIDESGKVTAFRFLHRPGHDLEAIAEQEIWRLGFEPARDDSGKAMASKVLWKYEWPPFHWAIDHKLLGAGGEGALTPGTHLQANRDLIADQQVSGWTPGPQPKFPNDRETDANRIAPLTEMVALQPKPTFVLPQNEPRPPCKGSGPLNLDTHEAVYRDCTPPNLGAINSEPLISRPAR